MSIKEKVKQICDSEFPNWSYVYEDWYGADAVVERVPLPAIIAIMPTTGAVEERNGRIYDREELALAFVDKVPKGANGEDNAIVYERMKKAAAMWVKSANASGYFEPISGEVKFEVIYEELTSVVTGVFVELSLKDKIGRC